MLRFPFCISKLRRDQSGLLLMEHRGRIGFSAAEPFYGQLVLTSLRNGG